VLRVRLLGEALGALPLDRSAATHEAEQAATFQIASSDLSVAGGFIFGRKEGAATPFVNPVSTAFCMQALTLWNDRTAGRMVAVRQELI
jgi:hypothetical protein